VSYEDLTSSPEETIQRVLRFIQVDSPETGTIPVSRLRRQADGVSAAWDARYRRQYALGWTPL
jgi:LPS sulfotransferase NodH